MNTYDELMTPYDQVIAYSKSAADTIGTNKYIYHAIRKMQPEPVDIPQFKDKFVIGTVMRSQYRKGTDQLALLLKTIFKMDAFLKDKILLYVHTPRISKATEDIFTFAKLFAIVSSLLNCVTIPAAEA